MARTQKDCESRAVERTDRGADGVDGAADAQCEHQAVEGTTNHRVSLKQQVKLPKRRDPEMRTCETLARELQTCAFQGLAHQKHHQNSTIGPPREGRKNENCGGRGKKSAKFWAPPTLQAPRPSGPHPSRPHGSGPHPLGRPPLPLPSSRSPETAPKTPPPLPETPQETRKEWSGGCPGTWRVGGGWVKGGFAKGGFEGRAGFTVEGVGASKGRAGVKVEGRRGASPSTFPSEAPLPKPPSPPLRSPLLPSPFNEALPS